MGILSLTCKQCGASLEVPEETRFHKCTDCSCELVVHNHDNKAYTELLTVSEALKWAFEKGGDRHTKAAKDLVAKDLDQPKYELLWYQFSLRDLLLFTAVVAVMLQIFLLDASLGIAWIFFLFYAAIQVSFVRKSIRLPHGQSPGRRQTVLWILLTWAILIPWCLWLAEMRTNWQELPRGLWLQMEYTCLRQLNFNFAFTAPLVIAVIGGFSRGSLRYGIKLIAAQILAVILVALIINWIVSMFAWPGPC